MTKRINPNRTKMLCKIKFNLGDTVAIDYTNKLGKIIEFLPSGLVLVDINGEVKSVYRKNLVAVDILEYMITENMRTNNA